MQRSQINKFITYVFDTIIFSEVGNWKSTNIWHIIYPISIYIYIQSIYFPISFVLRCISSYITPFFPVLLISSYILPFIRILLYILFNTIGFVLFLKYNGSVLRKIQRMGVVLVSLPVCLLRFVVLFSFIKLMFDRLFKSIILIIIIVYQSLKISTVVFCRS